MVAKRNMILCVLMAAALFVLSCTGCGNTQSTTQTTDTEETAAVTPGASVSATFTRKVDGDTAWFDVNGKEIKVRFLGIDTPETVKEGTPVEEWGPEASSYTEEALSDASEITLEFDKNSDLTDAYGRTLAWVWADGELLNKKLVENGLADVSYIYGDYKYTDELMKALETAKEGQRGLWQEGGI